MVNNHPSEKPNPFSSIKSTIDIINDKSSHEIIISSCSHLRINSTSSFTNPFHNSSKNRPDKNNLSRTEPSNSSSISSIIEREQLPNSNQTESSLDFEGLEFEQCSNFERSTSSDVNHRSFQSSHNSNINLLDDHEDALQFTSIKSTAGKSRNEIFMNFC